MYPRTVTPNPIPVDGVRVVIPVLITNFVRSTTSVTTYSLFQKLSAAPPKNIILFGLNPCAGLVVTVATPVLLVCVMALTCNPVPVN